MTTTRRIAFAAAFATAALALPSPAGAATTIGVEDDFFSPRKAAATVSDGALKWVWDLDRSSGGRTENQHDVVSGDGLFETGLENRGRFRLQASAGTFDYACTIHSQMTGKLAVEPQVERVDEGFRIRWAGPRSDTGDRYDVRFKRRVGGHWRRLEDNSHVKKVTFSSGSRREASTLRFKVRSQRGRDAATESDWSPTVSGLP